MKTNRGHKIETNSFIQCLSLDIKLAFTHILLTWTSDKELRLLLTNRACKQLYRIKHESLCCGWKKLVTEMTQTIRSWTFTWRWANINVSCWRVVCGCCFTNYPLKRAKMGVGSQPSKPLCGCFLKKNTNFVLILFTVSCSSQSTTSETMATVLINSGIVRMIRKRKIKNLTYTLKSLHFSGHNSIIIKLIQFDFKLINIVTFRTVAPASGSIKHDPVSTLMFWLAPGAAMTAFSGKKL